MKMRIVFSLLIVLFCISALNITVSFAQETPQSPLPKGAKARLVPHSVTGYASGITAIAYKPNSSILVTAGVRLILWDTMDNLPPLPLKVLDIDNSSGYYTAIAFSPDGTTLASASGKSVHLRDATTGRLRTWEVPGRGIIDTLELGGSHVGSIAFSPDGSTLIVDEGRRTGGGALSLWNIKDGRYIGGSRDGGGPVGFDARGVVYNPNGTLIANGGNYTGEVYLWTTTTTSPIKFIRTLEGFTRGVMSVAFSSDGTMLASAGWEETDSSWSVRLWNPVTYKLINTLKHSDDGNAHTMSVAFSPYGDSLIETGGSLIASSVGNIVRLWNATTGNLIRTCKGHTDIVWSVAFSPNGTTLASGSADGTVLLWGVPYGPVLGSKLVPAPDTPENIAADVNGDGRVNIQDLVAVTAAFGKTGKTPADVNGDGQVNIQDLVAVAAAFGEAAAGAPTASHLSAETVQQWLTHAQHLSLTDATSQRGIRFLEELLLELIPKETALLANYPNPFNPETWIPYQLASSTDVTLQIHAVDGTLVRTLSLGHKAIGVYQSRSRAAYWDGRNEIGEPIASGVYFYTLTAGDFTATRRMLIRK